MEILQHLLSNGYKLIPLKDGIESKQPRDIGYGERSYRIDDLSNNVGMIIPHGLVDVDLDWSEPRDHIAKFLPVTHMLFGRHGQLTHAIYRASIDGPKSFKLPKTPEHPLDGDHAYTVLELRTARKTEPYHVMIPPSVHPSGEPLKWIEKINGTEVVIEASEVDGDELVQCAGALAAFSVLLKFYPGTGSRDDFALALTGALLKGGWNEGDVENFIGWLAIAANDEEASARKSKAARTKNRLDAGKPVCGLTTLAKVAGIPYAWVAEIAVWLGVRKNYSGGPVVFDDGIIKNVSQQAWVRLEEYVIDGEPAIYAYGEALARIDRGRIDILDKTKLLYELNRCARWMGKRQDREGEIKWHPSNAKGVIADDMLSARGREVIVPKLNAISSVPVFTKTGRLLQNNGYDEASGIFIDLTVKVSVPDWPSKSMVKRALKNLFEPISQFPYADKSDKVHALALALEPFIRDVLESTPMYFINKPSPGTGATLLVGTSLFPALGEMPEAGTPPTREEEMEKVLTTKFKEGARVIFFDNADKLSSPSLAAAITAGTFTGRILGKSQSVRVPVRCVWVASGNNSEISDELYRRTIDIRMDAEMEHPEDRPISKFRIPDLKTWSRDNRRRQIEAALTILKYWINSGMPRGRASKASFETWASVMSGIFECINVKGFLATPIDRRPVDPILEETKGIILKWFELGSRRTEVPGDLQETDFAKPIKAKDVVEIIEAFNLNFDMQFMDPARAVGHRLRRFKGHTFEFTSTNGNMYRIKLSSRSVNGSLSWWLDVDVGAEEVLPPPPPF